MGRDRRQDSLETDLIQDGDPAPVAVEKLSAAMPEETLSPPDERPEEGPSPPPEVTAQPVGSAPEPRHPPAPPVDEAMHQRIRDDAYAEGLFGRKSHHAGRTRGRIGRAIQPAAAADGLFRVRAGFPTWT